MKGGTLGSSLAAYIYDISHSLQTQAATAGRYRKNFFMFCFIYVKMSDQLSCFVESSVAVQMKPELADFLFHSGVSL